MTSSERSVRSTKYDYRYSQLILLFGWLLREGRIQEAQLMGLSEEKLSSIRHIAALYERGPT